MRLFSKDHASRPRVDTYEYKRAFYRSQAVADDYDQHRFVSLRRRRSNERKWAAIDKALTAVTGVRRVLDLPCGTGRFTGRLAANGLEVIGCDISLEMIRKAVAIQAARESGVVGYVQANAERLPLRSDAVDCVISIRFMMHVDPETRIAILREFGRISNRWLIVDYRHRYSLKYRLRSLLCALGLARPPRERVTHERLQHEFASAGQVIRQIIPVARWFSDKWIVLSERGHS